MELMEFIAIIPGPVLIAAAILLIGLTVTLIYHYLRMKGLDGIRMDVYRLILRAEHMYKESGAGQKKLEWVVLQARDLLPTWLQLVITKDALMNIVNEWFKGVKDLLDDGKVNGSQKKEDTGFYRDEYY